MIVHGKGGITLGAGAGTGAGAGAGATFATGGAAAGFGASPLLPLLHAAAMKARLAAKTMVPFVLIAFLLSLQGENKASETAGVIMLPASAQVIQEGHSPQGTNQRFPENVKAGGRKIKKRPFSISRPHGSQ
jgi:hypothetical protein